MAGMRREWDKWGNGWGGEVQGVYVVDGGEGECGCMGGEWVRGGMVRNWIIYVRCL